MRRLFKLTDHEALILVAILVLNNNARAKALVDVVQQRFGLSVGLGVTYNVLTRTQRRGLVSTTKGPSTPKRGGRRKIFFRVTAKGLRDLAAMRDQAMLVWRDASPFIEARGRRSRAGYKSEAPELPNGDSRRAVQ